MGHMRTHTQELFFPDSTACDPGGEPGWTTDPLSHWTTEPVRDVDVRRCRERSAQCLGVCVFVCVGLQYIFISLYGRKTIRGKKWAVVVSLSVWHVTWKQEVLWFRREVREKRKKYRSVCLRLKKCWAASPKTMRKEIWRPLLAAHVLYRRCFCWGL